MSLLPTAPLLVVEDDELTRSFLVEHLAADGYDPTPAATMEEAITALERASPCLVLSDLTLPDGSGLDLVARIRSADGIVSRVDPATPVLLLTGRGGEMDRVRGFERGCDDYLVKPFSYPELRGLISSTGTFRRLADFKCCTGVPCFREVAADGSRRPNRFGSSETVSRPAGGARGVLFVAAVAGGILGACQTPMKRMSSSRSSRASRLRWNAWMLDRFRRRWTPR